MRWVYAKTVWSRALSQTWRDSTGGSWTNRLVQIVLVLAPVATGFGWQYLRPHSTVGSSFLTNAELTTLSALAGLGAVMLMFFLWHLIVAVPYEIWREEKERADAPSATGPDYLRDELERRKAEMLADAIMPRRRSEPMAGNDGMRKRLEYLAAESAKRCPEMPIWEAVEYVRQVIGDDDFQNCYPEARRQIRQAALEDRLEIWGRKEIPPNTYDTPLGASRAWSKIEPNYWTQHELSSLAIGQLFQEREHTWEEAFKNKIGDRYWELKVRQPQLDRIWRVKQPPGGPDRSLLIANGRDLAHRYRSEGMPEPFGSFVAKQRTYLDIKPHLGAEYVTGAHKRAELSDTTERRDYSAGMFERELARLEKEWKL
jgi:hypothetical protein